MKYSKGFSLVEIVLAVAVFAAIAAGIVLTIGNSAVEFRGTDDSALKERYATEAVEAVISLRDASWGSIADVTTSTATDLTTYDIRQNEATGRWEFFLGTTTRNGLQRNVFVYDVERDSGGNIVTSGGTWDPSTKKIVVKVLGGAVDYELESYVSNWRNYVVNQTDWSGVDSVEVWAATSLSDDIYSSSSIGTSTAGEVSLFQTSYDDWYDDAWSSRTKITIQNSQIDAALTNFPVYVDLSAAGFSDLRTYASASDIIVVDEDDTKLERELVSLTGSDGELWFRALFLASTSTRDFHIYYNNSGASEVDSTSVWSNNFNSVHHLEEGDTGPYDDSGPNGFDGTEDGTLATVTGEIGDGFGKVTNLNDNVTLSSYHQDSGSGADRTVFAWIYRENSFTSTYYVFQPTYNFACTLRGDISLYDGSAWRRVPASVPQDEWARVVWRGDSTAGEYEAFLNGTSQGTTTYSNTTISSNSAFIGSGNVWAGFKGDVDEVWLTSDVKSDAWIDADFNNQSTPASFYTAATAQSISYSSAGQATSTAAVIAYATSADITNRDPLTLRWTQEVPSGCSLDIYLQATNTQTAGGNPDWTQASLLGPLSASGTAKATTTIDLNQYSSISGKKWLRYGISMSSCNSDTQSPKLYDINIEVD